MRPSRFRRALLFFVAAVVFTAADANGQRYKEWPEYKERLRRLQRMWDECRDAWFEGGQRTFEERYKLFKRLKPDRELTPKQKDCILRVGDLLFATEWPEEEHRWQAAGWLGDMGHAYCIPPLLAVLRDEQEAPNLRARCIVALSYITDKRVVDPIIEALGDESQQVAHTAKEQLDKIFCFVRSRSTVIPHPGIGWEIGWREGDLEWRKEFQGKYRAWWEKNKDRVAWNREEVSWM